MSLRNPLLSLAALLAVPLTGAAVDGGSSTASEKVVQAVLARDAALSQAYNECADARLRSMFTHSVEVYVGGHGVGRDVGALVADMHESGCGKFRREVDPASVRVQALPGFGALQTGVERYCTAGREQCEGVAVHFMSVWRYRDGHWRIARLVRFDHERLRAKGPG